MHLHDLLESPAADIDRVMDARAAFTKFTGWLNARNEHAPLWQCGLREWRTAQDDLWMVSTEGLGIDLPNAFIGIGWRRDGKASVNPTEAYVTTGRGEDGPFSLLVMLVQDDPRERTDVCWGLDMSKFAHEWTHLVDYARGYLRHRSNMERAYAKKGRRWMKSTDTEAGLKAYFNSPVEFNGYYQQGMEGVIKDIEMSARRARETFEGKYLRSYSDFKRFAPSNFNRDWMRQLNSDYKRRFDKRFYKFYELVKSQWPDVEILERLKAASRAALEKWKAENPEEAAEIDWTAGAG